MIAVPCVPPHFTCVVAFDLARGIGHNGDLPWPTLPGDLAHFKRLTTQVAAPGQRNAVIMGRRTWDSIPPRFRPLSGRRNLVVSRGSVFGEGAEVVSTLNDAIARASDSAAIHVIGGGQIYAQAIADPRCQLLYITQLLASFATDTAFPPFADRFELEEAEPENRDAGVWYRFERWRRVLRPA